MSSHPPEPRVVHPLPPAPQFVGREPELEALRSAWKAGFRGVLALVGLGGAGKTAVASHFVDELLVPSAAPCPDGLFVWSFYQQPDTGLFLQEALRYFARSDETTAHGPGILHLLHTALEEGGPHLLVLDGLERVQRQESTGAYGQLEDPLLKGLLMRLAEGLGNTTALVTSRFPLTDLEAFQGSGYRPLDVGGLDTTAARALLRRRGVAGEFADLDRLIAGYGAHALTLDHLGGLLGQFLGGDPLRAPEAPGLATPGSDRQALRLARLLRAYEEHLPPAELALLCRLCLLRRSVREEQVRQLFLCTPAIRARTVRELCERIPDLPIWREKQSKGRLDLADAVCSYLEDAVWSEPHAGPEESFRGEVLAVVTHVVATTLRESKIGMEALTRSFLDLARRYAVLDLDVPTDQCPLSGPDREVLRELSARYLELRNNPGLPYTEKVDPVLLHAFEQLGYEKRHRRPASDLHPADLWTAYVHVQQMLAHLLCKHLVLVGVRGLCRQAREKWSLAGPLATLDAAGLHAVLEALIGRHLLLREADGSVSIHPAVRDHFHRLALASAQGGWHDLLREQMISLARQPGQRLPQDPVTLDLTEEAIYHALQAGRRDEAEFLYRDVLGGMRHLAWKLGEAARGLRILRGFDPCPDPGALAWFLRMLGEFEEAHAHHPMAFFRADVRLLQGRLPEVAAEGDDARTAAAAFLMGQTGALPPDLFGCTVPRDQLLLYLGRLGMVPRTEGLEALYQDVGREGDCARCRLFLAEAARRQGDTAGCRTHLETASPWVLHSGSVEHLCLWHLVRARAARDNRDLAAARRAVEEGLHLARRCGLGLYHVELLCEQAEQLLLSGEAVSAEAVARDARRRAAAPECRFRWGQAAAGQLFGQALFAQGQKTEARWVLEETAELRWDLGDPRVEETERWLRDLPEKQG